MMTMNKKWWIVGFLALFAVLILFCWTFFYTEGNDGLAIRQALEKTYGTESVDIRFAEAETKDLLGSHVNFPSMTPVSTFDSRDNDRRGIAVRAGAQARFYPFDVLGRYEVVNDEIAGQPILVAYCTVCETAVIADRVVDGEEVFFYGTNYLWQGSLIMGSGEASSALWDSATGEELIDVGPRQLSFLPFDIYTLNEFRREYSDGAVMTVQ